MDRSFFKGQILDIWRSSKSPEETAHEVEFLQEQFADIPNQYLLDFPCGAGRLSMGLAMLDYIVTGIDSCTEYIAEAKRTAKALQLSVQFIEQDLRHDFSSTSFHKFGGAFCMGNSFGYFNMAETKHLFSQLSYCMAPGAKLVIESEAIAESYLLNVGEREWMEVTLNEKKAYLLVKTNYDPISGIADAKYIVVEDERTCEYSARHYIYRLGEVAGMLDEAGFRLESVLSSLDGDDFRVGDNKVILIARKEEK
ncbi:MAG: class I SAM-dependent methyltransferase [Candidatus Obscuribacterales bacterium]|nr:class I SAM-dependent methyltransferase [Candidatus Obscuribacterales bacterium]